MGFNYKIICDFLAGHHTWQALSCKMMKNMSHFGNDGYIPFLPQWTIFMYDKCRSTDVHVACISGVPIQAKSFVLVS